MGQPKHRITGMGAVSAAGWGLEATAARLFAGKITQVTNPEETRFFQLSGNAGTAKTDFAPNAFAMSAVEEALRTAGLARDQLRDLRVGVCVGSTVGCTNYQEDFGRDFFAGKFPAIEPLKNFFHNNTAQFIARRLGLRGPVQMLSNACTSGVDAIGVAAGWLDAGVCDLVICGGTEAILPRMYFGFRSLMLCAPDRCKPFDRARQGLTLGEGAGVLLLEKSSSPRAALAEFLGYGSASDAYHPTSPDPEARGLDLAVRHCGRRDTFTLPAVDFINAHGTGTPHNDLAEGRWIAKHVSHAQVLATKGYTGHTLGAAGALEAVISILCLQNGLLPPTLGFSQADPEIGVVPTQTLESGDFKTALSLSLGFGGLNSALALGKAL
jgi:3-oxoacyl-(acyl-carrier-protein) synthase